MHVHPSVTFNQMIVQMFVHSAFYGAVVLGE